MISEKNVRQSITISKKEFETINQICKDYNCSYSEFFRKAAHCYMWCYFQEYIAFEGGNYDD